MFSLKNKCPLLFKKKYWRLIMFQKKVWLKIYILLIIIKVQLF